MNPSMMATRNALPLSNPATLMYIHEKTATTDARTTTRTTDIALSKPRNSTRTRLSLKMKELFSSNKTERRNRTWPISQRGRAPSTGSLLRQEHSHRRDEAASRFEILKKDEVTVSSKKTKAEPASEEDEAERKRSTMAQLVGSHAFVQLGRR
ncbi:Minor histocompatibility antigen H13 [Phytophthora nicotianae]|uniref:Minor histocompatibility antigen H13 n=1 Tax=Phytophthora nicotianae TaxID=4792 RepID=A0A0W8D1F0_PHYNI|nr:Minor histocompatibility antigen H13 [Phytophthora nicotianae]